MPSWSTLILFATAASILVFMPGPNTLYIIARSIQQGRMAGILSSLGVQVGTLFHVAAAAFGVSTLLLTSATAFNLVKFAGAVYLIYLGVRTFTTKEKIAHSAGAAENHLGRVFWQGAFVQLLNPKTALFFFSFLPQFVDFQNGTVLAQILIFGGVLLVLGTISDFIYVLMAGGAASFLRTHLKFLRLQRYFAGSVYIGLGLATAFTGTTRR